MLFMAKRARVEVPQNLAPKANDDQNLTTIIRDFGHTWSAHEFTANLRADIASHASLIQMRDILQSKHLSSDQITGGAESTRFRSRIQ